MRTGIRLFLTLFGLSCAMSLSPACSCDDQSGAVQQDAALPQDVLPPQEDVRPPQEDVLPPQEDVLPPQDGPLPDGYRPDGYFETDAGIPWGLSITEVVPGAIPSSQDNALDVHGTGFQSDAAVTITNCDTGTEYPLGVTGVTGSTVIAVSAPATLGLEQGLYAVTVSNPGDGTVTSDCILWVSGEPPPTVTDVKPASAYNGDPADGINSDELVAITGTGFQSTPNVRWEEIATGKLFDAILVGFIDDQHLTALCPSETKKMPVGGYRVWAVNPDLLSAKWIVPATSLEGVFQITGTPPPKIDSVTPQSLPGTDCPSTTFQVTGSGFVSGSTFWLVMPPGVNCPGGLTQALDAQGNTICQVQTSTFVNATHATFQIGTCPGNGNYPVEVINPDGQAGFYYVITLMNSSTCHLNVGSWETGTPTFPALGTPRYLFAASTGCDEFGHAYLYAAGGLDSANGVIDTVEFSEVDLYGLPGPWSESVQYLDADHPRVTNTLGGLSNPQGRSGLTMVRVGRHLYAIGGVTADSNITGAVNAVATVEHAAILGYETMPMAHLPTVEGNGGLPRGAWYYRASAIGSFGESLASEEVVILNQGGTLSFCWTAPPAGGATQYNVYRSLASDGRSRSEVLLAAGVAGVASGISCFLDNGFGALTPAPGRLRGTVDPSAGTLTAGTYQYQISATIDDGVAAAHETLGGYPLKVTLATGTTGQIVLHWDPVQYVAQYHLFKWNGNEYALFANVDGAALTFTDDGTAPAAPTCPVGRTDDPCGPLAGIPPLPFGSLSTWGPTGVNLATPREGLDGVPIVFVDNTPSPPQKTTYILVAGGRSANDTAHYLNTAESVKVDPTTGALVSTNADPTKWVAELQTMAHARAFFPLLTNQGRNDPTFCPPAAQPPCPDADGDGYIDCACATPAQQPCDCDDTNPAVHPGGPGTPDPDWNEVGKCSNGLDDDCDGLVDCADPDCATDGHCTDGGIIEIPDSGVPDGFVCPDTDGDGYPAAWCGGTDCCDDGTEASLGCAPDTAAGINPGAAEVCGDGIDQNCDGLDEVCPECPVPDADGDGHLSIACGGDDCCDTGQEGTDFFGNNGVGTVGCNPQNAGSIFPTNYDACQDGIDQNCDGWDNVCVVGGQPRAARGRSSSRTPAALLGRLASAPTAARIPWESLPRPPQSHVALRDLYGPDPRIWVVAVEGQEVKGADGLQTLEVCEVSTAPDASGILRDCDTVTGGAQAWTVQAEGIQHPTHGHEAVLYGQMPGTVDPTVTCLYNFSGVASQSVGGPPSPANYSGSRFPFYANPAGALTAILGGRTSFSTTPSTTRAYYQMLRLNAYIFVVGGYADTGVNGSIERHQQ
jgi:hypothetical protein